MRNQLPARAAVGPVHEEPTPHSQPAAREHAKEPNRWTHVLRLHCPQRPEIAAVHGKSLWMRSQPPS